LRITSIGRLEKPGVTEDTYLDEKRALQMSGGCDVEWSLSSAEDGK
jgi:hypothetical protein